MVSLGGPLGLGDIIIAGQSRFVAFPRVSKTIIHGALGFAECIPCSSRGARKHSGRPTDHKSHLTTSLPTAITTVLQDEEF